MTQPLGNAERWELTMEAADYRCQCTNGACGSPHTSTGRRCKAVHDIGRVRLIAAPPDLTTPDRVAVELPACELQAWCSDCYSAAKRRQRLAVAEVRRRRNGPDLALF